MTNEIWNAIGKFLVLVIWLCVMALQIPRIISALIEERNENKK